MTARPIIFNAPMVRALLEGRKTQTRSVVKLNHAGRAQFGGRNWHLDDPNATQACPYGQPGELLWVRETFCGDRFNGIGYRATDAPSGRWKSPIHMPRWASRLTLRITSVRVERLQAISEDDAKAEGVYSIQCNDLGTEVPYYRSMFEPRDLYRMVWESIHGHGSWDANPWVWAVSFEVLRQNVDAIREAA